MRTCRYCEAVDEAGGRKCRNCGAAYMDAPEPVRSGPLASFEDFVKVTGWNMAALKAEARAETDHLQSPEETYQRVVRNSQRRGIILP